MVDLIVMCAGIRDSGNLGALARLCDNFNAKSLVAIAPVCEVDGISYMRATRGKQYLDNIVIVQYIEEAREYADIIIGLSSRVGSLKNLPRSGVSIQEVASQLKNYEGTVAVLLGREDSGLSNEEVIACDFLAYIPIPSENPVLNISHAAALALWELSRDEDYSSISDHKKRMIRREELEAFMNYLKLILSHSWLVEDKHESTLKVYRSLLTRSLVTDREAPALIGSLRSIYRGLTERHPPWDDCLNED